MPDPINPDVMHDDYEYQVPGMDHALMALNRSEIDTQIATAKRFPRSIKHFVQEATEMVQLNEEIASECMYALKRRDSKSNTMKTIEGPSARFAEIIASAWGNCRAGARVVGEDDRFVTAQGAFMDLQRNSAITYETKRPIASKREGKYVKYSDDMVGVTSNAACSIALRNAVLKGIPKAFWKPIYEAARKTAVGDARTLADRRADMLAYFAKMGVSEQQVFEYLEVPGVEDISLDHLALLKGLATAIRDGDTTVDEAFGPAQNAPGGRVRKSKLNEKLEAEPKPAAPSDPWQPLQAALSEFQTAQQVEDFAATTRAKLAEAMREEFDLMCHERKEALKAKPAGKLFEKHHNVGQ